MAVYILVAKIVLRDIEEDTSAYTTSVVASLAVVEHLRKGSLWQSNLYS